MAGVVLGLRARRPRSGGALRITGRVLAAALLVLVLAAVVWLRLYATTSAATTETSTTVEVVHTLSTWELHPRGGPVGAGVVFYPGALVRPPRLLAAAAPAGRAGASRRGCERPAGPRAARARCRHRRVRRPPRCPVLGGRRPLAGRPARVQHGGGGDPRVRGLFLWASYPAQDISGAHVAATSISGDRDGLTTPADVAASRARLPPGTTFTVVAGGVQAYFGDYGPQAGDGEPATDRADAQRQIIEATATFVAGLG